MVVIDGFICFIDLLGVVDDVDVLEVRLRAPFQIFHLLPLSGVLEAHVVTYGVGMGKAPRADVHRTDG